jgi:hypothetical protein
VGILRSRRIAVSEFLALSHIRGEEKGSGRSNLAQGMFGTAIGIGALSGMIVHHFGYSEGLIGIAVEGLLALMVVYSFCRR